NLSSDATAPGTSGLINQTAADVFVNVASDLHLKAGSPAIGAGTKILDFDALGNPRGTPDDMGALRTYVEPSGCHGGSIFGSPLIHAGSRRRAASIIHPGPSMRRRAA
ncbi:MAG: choice-of-anchor Q domain-containing protein, partial [Planctomycetaceae bacterium]